jgi:lipopolysaccharide transport system ATP-binding protein
VTSTAAPAPSSATVAAEPMVALDGVSKRYRSEGRARALREIGQSRRAQDHWAVREATLHVAAGEVVGVIGRNGSGKSTLLRLAAGLTRATAGSVRVGGSVGALVSLGGSFQGTLTGAENALTAAILAGVPRREARRNLERIAAWAELEDHMDQPLRTYSDGMRLRLAFATAVHARHPVLVIDEVLSVGDLRFQQKCVEWLHTARDRGCAVLVASHDLSQVEQLCGRAVWMDEGRIRLVGPPEEIVDEYRSGMRRGAPEQPGSIPGTIRRGDRSVEVTGVRLLDGRTTTGGAADERPADAGRDRSRRPA